MSVSLTLSRTNLQILTRKMKFAHAGHLRHYAPEVKQLDLLQTAIYPSEVKIIKQWIAPMAASVVLISGDCLLAQGWPQWRGKNRDGKVFAFAAPSTWPTNLTQKWKLNVGKQNIRQRQ
jgi:hypothetical protein